MRHRLIRSLNLCLLISAAGFWAVKPAFANLRLLHQFVPEVATNGADANGLTLDGGVLYGVTPTGGPHYGTSYKINLSGAGFKILHNFAVDDSNDGISPVGTVAIHSGTLYGVTSVGGWSRRGTVYKQASDATGYERIHEFEGDGDNPTSLVLNGTTLYGTCAYGGSAHFGVLFKLNFDGSGFQILHNFSGGAGDGRYPIALTFSGTEIYGVTEYGGSANRGTVFKLNLDGTGYEQLHEFAGGANDGADPQASVTVLGGALYGTTHAGGDVNAGTLFRLSLDGTGYTLLHEFIGGASDGAFPAAPLLFSNGALYGTTRFGGDANSGTVFRLFPNATGLELLHEFAGGGADGAAPSGTFVIDESTLYGTTGGGGNNDWGTIFALDLPRNYGDYNHDGKVDAADYVMWRKFDSGSVQAFIDWRTNFGRSVGNASLVQSIPEPDSLFAMIGLLAVAAGYHGRLPRQIR